jgi:GntR family transcriptional regulator
VRPGVGTVVTCGRRSSAAERRALLSHDVEQLIVEAKRLGLDADDIIDAVEEQWAKLFGDRVRAASG